MTLILLNLAAMIFETTSNRSIIFNQFLEIFELTSIVIFTIEYLIRIYVSEYTHPTSSKIKSAVIFIFSGFGIIDLLSILPFYLPLFITMDLRFLRILRFIRFFRILKIGRYDKSIHLIGNVIRDKKSELIMTGFISLIIILISSFIMYYVEHPHQPDKFSSILDSFWWAIATLTTVGYGDIYPVTGIGRFISGVIAIIGIGLIALPTGIISSGFIDEIRIKNKDKKCPHCGKDLI